MTNMSRLRQLTASAIAVIALSTLAGCGGGGGGGGGGTSGPLPATLIGTIDATAGAPAAGYSVHFGLLSTTTSSSGAFSFSFDAAQISGTQTLTIYDTTGALVDQETVTINASGGQQTVGPFNVGPPPPPPGA